MTVSANTARKDYSGNGSTTAFPTTFKFLINSDIKVILRVDSTQVETIQAETTNYTLAGAGVASGGTVTMLVAPATGETLVIKRQMAFTQLTDYVENDPFPAESHEQALDRAKMELQELSERADRSLHFAETSGLTDVELPDAVANLGLKWNPTADGLVNTSVDPDASATAAAVSAAAALVSENNSSANVVLTNADVVSTNADVVSTNADVVSTNADVVSSAASATAASNSATLIPISVTGAGTADAITADFVPNLALVDKTTVYVVAVGANTITNPTLAIDGGVAKTITKNGNQTLKAGNIFGAGHILHLQYDSGADVWELLNPRQDGVLADGSVPFTATQTGVSAVAGTDLTIKSDVDAHGLVQRVHSQSGTLASFVPSAVTPLDNTIPQVSETDLLTALNVTITPTNTSNLLYIDITVMFSLSVAGWGIVSLFQDALTPSLATSVLFTSTANVSNSVTFRHKVVAGSLTARTYKVGLGSNGGALNSYFNGRAGGAEFGGVTASSMTVTEVKV